MASESSTDLRRIIDTIPALVWSANPDGSAVFVNRHYLDFVGLGEGGLQGWRWSAVVHPDDLARVNDEWKGIRDSGAPGEGEMRLRRHDGVYRWFLYRANPFRDASGRIVQWYGVNTDIEDRKRAALAEEALDHARSELVRVARRTTITALTAFIAHEVNQPLTGILTNAALCARMLTGTAPNLDGARDGVRRITRDGERAAQFVAQLRELFGRRAFSPEPVDLNEAVGEVVAMATNELKRRHIAIDWQPSPGLPKGVGDRAQLQQVFVNLVCNAMVAMHDVADRPRELAIRSLLDGDGRIRISVRDTGVGLQGQPPERLFRPFQSARGNGMGIGLAVSRMIIERHDGRLWAEPNEGPGATFSFSIPSA